MLQKKLDNNWDKTLFLISLTNLAIKQSEINLIEMAVAVHQNILMNVVRSINLIVLQTSHFHQIGDIQIKLLRPYTNTRGLLGIYYRDAANETNTAINQQIEKGSQTLLIKSRVEKLTAHYVWLINKLVSWQ